MDPELRDAFERLTSDLRTQIQSGDAELRDALERVAGELRTEIRSVDVDLRTRLDAATAKMRRHFDVVGEALRGDIRSLAELMAISNERVGSLSSASRSR